MIVVAAPYVIGWLALVLLMLDPSPLRVALSMATLASALGMRLGAQRPVVRVVASLGAVVLLGVLVLTSSSLAGLGRVLLGAVFGTAALYCCLRAWRG